VQEAYFSNDGTAVAVASVNNYIRDTFVATIDIATESLVGTAIPPNAENVFLKDSDTVFYTRSLSNELTGYEYAISNQAQRELFQLPFTQVLVRWGEPTYVITRPADNILGYVYTIESGSYVPTDHRGYGLIATILGNYLAVTTQTADGPLQSLFVNETTEEVFGASTTVLPEKCTELRQVETIVCADTLTSKQSVADWYKGVVTYEDVLWTLDVERNRATLVSNLSRLSGRPIDVLNLTSNDNGSAVLFTNRLDNTLWRNQL
jgi:hypothetical protein